MSMSFTARVLLLGLVTAGAHAARPDPVADPAQFAQEVAAEHGIEAGRVGALLGQAVYRQSIIDAITRPAEAKPWHAYRPIFLNAARIEGGRAFLAQHRAQLQAVQERTGVPAELIVAIIGVETNYGRITGSYRVIDALYTLGFYYPRRADFFRAELGHLFALAQEEGLDPLEVSGSYAGAMGWGQFIPSSYRAYAVDGDGDGRRDLWNSRADIFASIANYFVAHGWEADAPVAIPAQRAVDAEPFVPETLEALMDLPELAAKGYRPRYAIGRNLPATLLTLEGRGGPEYWITFGNFYVISRYNRSPLYSLAVYQLAQALGHEGVGVPAP
ncbi:MAG TPA: lytic murein transglycosylase B [Xanthomonadaceae bacterium]|nr:lytic murein transglycosylase B [Xanthomonadaceae bacterium]